MMNHSSTFYTPSVSDDDNVSSTNNKNNHHKQSKNYNNNNNNNDDNNNNNNMKNGKQKKIQQVKQQQQQPLSFVSLSSSSLSLVSNDESFYSTFTTTTKNHNVPTIISVASSTNTSTVYNFNEDFETCDDDHHGDDVTSSSSYHSSTSSLIQPICIQEPTVVDAVVSSSNNVRLIGGTYKGQYGTFIKYTPKRIVVRIMEERSKNNISNNNNNNNNEQENVFSTSWKDHYVLPQNVEFLFHQQKQDDISFNASLQRLKKLPPPQIDVVLPPVNNNNNNTNTNNNNNNKQTMVKNQQHTYQQQHQLDAFLNHDNKEKYGCSIIRSNNNSIINENRIIKRQQQQQQQSSSSLSEISSSSSWLSVCCISEQPTAVGVDHHHNTVSLIVSDGKDDDDDDDDEEESFCSYHSFCSSSSSSSFHKVIKTTSRSSSDIDIDISIANHNHNNTHDTGCCTEMKTTNQQIDQQVESKSLQLPKKSSSPLPPPLLPPPSLPAIVPDCSMNQTQQKEEGRKDEGTITTRTSKKHIPTSHYLLQSQQLHESQLQSQQYHHRKVVVDDDDTVLVEESANDEIMVQIVGGTYRGFYGMIMKRTKCRVGVRILSSSSSNQSQSHSNHKEVSFNDEKIHYLKPENVVVVVVDTKVVATDTSEEVDNNSQPNHHHHYPEQLQQKQQQQQKDADMNPIQNHSAKKDTQASYHDMNEKGKQQHRCNMDDPFFDAMEDDNTNYSRTNMNKNIMIPVDSGDIEMTDHECDLRMGGDMMGSTCSSSNHDGTSTTLLKHTPPGGGIHNNVRIIGGTKYKGQYGTYIKHTPKRIVVRMIHRMIDDRNDDSKNSRMNNNNNTNNNKESWTNDHYFMPHHVEFLFQKQSSSNSNSSLQRTSKSISSSPLPSISVPLVNTNKNKNNKQTVENQHQHQQHHHQQQQNKEKEHAPVDDNDDEDDEYSIIHNNKIIYKNERIRQQNEQEQSSSDISLYSWFTTYRAIGSDDDTVLISEEEEDEKSFCSYHSSNSNFQSVMTMSNPKNSHDDYDHNHQQPTTTTATNSTIAPNTNNNNTHTGSMTRNQRKDQVNSRKPLPTPQVVPDSIRNVQEERKRRDTKGSFFCQQQQPDSVPAPTLSNQTSSIPLRPLTGEMDKEDEHDVVETTTTRNVPNHVVQLLSPSQSQAQQPVRKVDTVVETANSGGGNDETMVQIVGGTYRGFYGMIMKRTKCRVGVRILSSSNQSQSHSNHKEALFNYEKIHYVKPENVVEVDTSQLNHHHHHLHPIQKHSNDYVQASYPDENERWNQRNKGEQFFDAIENVHFSNTNTNNMIPVDSDIEMNDFDFRCGMGESNGGTLLKLNHKNPQQLFLPNYTSSSLREDYIVLADENQLTQCQKTLGYLLFGDRIRTIKKQVMTSKKNQTNLPPLWIDTDGSHYELLSLKFHRDTTSGKCSHFRTDWIQAQYVKMWGPPNSLTTTSPSISASTTTTNTKLNLQQELEKFANFGELVVEKVAARLELLQSTACMNKQVPLVYNNDSLTIHDLEEIDEIAHEGCGFMPVGFVQRYLGHHAVGQRTFAIQVRIIAPQLGIYKGMLMEKYGIDKILLPPSMKKVGPAIVGVSNDESNGHLEHPNNSVYILINGTFPSKVNTIQIPKILQGIQPCKSFKPDKLGEMIIRMFQDWPIPINVIDRYVKESHIQQGIGLHHTYVVGLADPTDCIPPGTIFITGLGRNASATLWKERNIFVTRCPCTDVQTDAHVLPLLTERPERMVESMWSWLCQLPFGGIIFGNPASTQDIPLPCQIAKGDLDGDLYFICWNKDILNHLRLKPKKKKKNIVNDTSTPSTPKQQQQNYNPDWLKQGQDWMSDVHRLSQLNKLISCLYKLWKDKRDGNSTTRDNKKQIKGGGPLQRNSSASNDVLQASSRNDDPAVVGNRIEESNHFGRAYKAALDVGKHGGLIELPYNLWKEVPEALYSFLTVSSISTTTGSNELDADVVPA